MEILGTEFGVRPVCGVNRTVLHFTTEAHFNDFVSKFEATTEGVEGVDDGLLALHSPKLYERLSKKFGENETRNGTARGTAKSHSYPRQIALIVPGLNRDRKT